ncbi:hypothetical protein AAVH_30649 [Aphelenchoides avenae]|nr:hypothetical protein AAVH_30649 [Aphelenchus avenae]
MDVDVKVEPSEMTDEQEFLLFDVLENGEEMETIDFDDVTEVPTSSKEDSQPPTGLKVVAPRGGHKATCNGYAMDSLYTNSEGLLFWRCSKYATLGCPGSALSEELDGALVERQRHNHPAKDPRPKKTKAKKKHSRMKVPTKRKNASMGLSKGKGTKRCAGHLSMCNGYEMQSEYMNQHGAVGWRCAEYATRGCMARAFSKGLHGELLERKSHNHIPGQMPENENAVLDMMESAHELSGNETVEASSVSARHIHQSKQPRRWRTSLCNGYAMRVQRVLPIGIRWQCMQKALFKCSGWATSDLDGADLTQQGPHNHVSLSAALKIKKLALMTPACRKRRAIAPLKAHEKRPPAKTKSKRKPTAKSSRHLLRCDAYKEVDGYFMRCASAAHSGMVHWVCRQRKGFKCNGSATSDFDGEQFTMRRTHNHDPAPLKVHQRGANGGALKWDRQLLRCDACKEIDGYFMRCSTASSNGVAYWGCRQATGFKCKASASSDLDGKEFTMRQPHNHDPAPLVRRGGGEAATYDRNLLRCDVNKEVDGYFMRCSTASSNDVGYWVCRQKGSFNCNASATSDLDGNEFSMRQPHNHDPAPLAQRGGGEAITRDRNLLRCDAHKEIDGYFMRCSTASSNGVAYWGCRQRDSFDCNASATSDLDGQEFIMRQPHTHDPAPLGRRRGRKPREETLPAWCITERRNLRSDMDAEGDPGSSSNAKHYADDSDDSERSASPARPKKIRALARKVVEKTPVSPFYGKCRGRMALCEGYHMRSVYVTKKGLLYWKCAKQTTFKCPGSAMSDPNGGELVESQAHNHEPVPLYKWMSVRKAGRPREDKKWESKNLHLLHCDVFATVDGYLMRCMNVSVGTGMSYWYCRLCMRFKCRGSATSDLYGKDFMPVQPHNHPPEGMMRKSSSQLSSFGSSTMKWFKDISDDDEPSSSYKSQTVKTEKHEGAIGVGTTSKDDDEFDKLVAASAGFDDFYIDLTQDDALAECDL